MAAAAAFPVAGVWILRLNLLPYRFMLMHGAMLGGAIALATGIGQLPVVVIVNLLLVLLADAMTNRGRLDGGMSTMFLMVASLGGAMALLYGASVPAQDALALLWGSLFAVSPEETAATVLYCLGLLLYARLRGRRIQAVIYDRDVAFTTGVNAKAEMRGLLVVTALTVAFAMRLIGALLLDALLLIPAIIASQSTHSLSRLYRNAVFIGLATAIAGFITALLTDLPVGASTALIGSAALGIVLLVKGLKK
jgi:zinc transport system permease protein